MTLADANLAGNVHGGVIMREVDSAAGTCAIRHADTTSIVTVAIDELSFHEPVHVGEILIVSASINFVGRTSMEVGVHVEAEPLGGGKRRHTTSAFLVMVALDCEQLPDIVLETDEHRRKHDKARIRKQARSQRREAFKAAGH
jgi:acyl-CoA hydrolase